MASFSELQQQSNLHENTKRLFNILRQACIHVQIGSHGLKKIKRTNVNKKKKQQKNGASVVTPPEQEDIAPGVQTIAKSGRDISETAGRVLPTVIEEALKKQNPTPEKMGTSLKKGGNKFDSILEYETSPTGPANKRFKTKDDLLDYFEKRPKLLKEPVGIGGKTIGSGFSWMGDRSKQLDLNLQHYVIKELAKRKEQRRKNKKPRNR